MKVGVVGLGTMGAGIAQLAVEAGLETVGREVSDELGEAARGRIEHFLTRKVEKGQIDSFDFGLLTLTTDLSDFADCDVVIEAIVEELGPKRELFAELERVCRPDAVLATNTSALSVTEIAGATSTPERVVGHALLQPGAAHAARRDRPRRAHVRRGVRDRVRARGAARQASDPLPRHAGLRRQPRPDPAPQRLRPRARRGARHARRPRRRHEARRRLADGPVRARRPGRASTCTCTRARRSGRSCASRGWRRRRVSWRWRTPACSAARAAAASTGTATRAASRLGLEPQGLEDHRRRRLREQLERERLEAVARRARAPRRSVSATRAVVRRGEPLDERGERVRLFWKSLAGMATGASPSRRTFLRCRSTLGSAHAADPASSCALLGVLVAAGCGGRPCCPRLPSPASSSSRRRRVTAASTAARGHGRRPRLRARPRLAGSAGRDLPPALENGRGTPQVHGADVSQSASALAQLAREGVQRQQLPLPRDRRLLPRRRARLRRLPLRRRPRPVTLRGSSATPHAPTATYSLGRRARSARLPARDPCSGRSGALTVAARRSRRFSSSRTSRRSRRSSPPTSARTASRSAMTASGREALTLVGVELAVARRPRPDAARSRRARGLPADPRDEHSARADAHGARRRPRQDRRPRGRRRRLPHEALQPARARRPGAGDPAPQRRRERREPDGGVLRARRARARRRPPRVPRRGGGDPAGAEGVRPALGAPRPPGPRSHARPAARARLGLHVRGRHPHGRRARPPAAAEARRRVADRDGVGHRLQGRPGARPPPARALHVQVTALPAAGAVPARHRARGRRRDAHRRSASSRATPARTRRRSCGAESAGIVHALRADRRPSGTSPPRNLELALGGDRDLLGACGPGSLAARRPLPSAPAQRPAVSRRSCDRQARRHSTSTCSGTAYLGVAQDVKLAAIPVGALVVAKPESALRSRWLQLVWRLAHRVRRSGSPSLASSSSTSRAGSRGRSRRSPTAADEVAAGHYDVELPEQHRRQRGRAARRRGSARWRRGSRSRSSSPATSSCRCRTSCGRR